MECETEWVDPRMPMTDEYLRILHELFEDRIGEGSMTSVVTRDVPDCAVAVGNPAKAIKVLDAERFAD